jgi:CheY-specific phosphatase CheX
MSAKDVFDQIVIASATELFAARGIPVRPAGKMAASIEYAATLGFSSNQMRGMIGLGMSPETMQRVMSQDQQAGPTGNAEDWLAESVNQLLGRLKNKLMNYGIVLSIALPTVLQGLRLQFLGTGSTTLWAYSMESDHGPFWVWLDVRSDQELVLTPVDDPELQATAEGELVLF